MALEDWIKKHKFPSPRALEVGTQIHTSPEAYSNRATRCCCAALAHSSRQGRACGTAPS
jgi:hypothetical protein